MKIQRFGTIRFANVATSKPAYAAKAKEIVDSLQGPGRIGTFLNNKNALITLEYEPMLASVRIVGDQVQIKLSPWFFEQQTTGRILGMLAHEFGVHPVAAEAMNAGQLTQEDTDYNANTAFNTRLVGHSVTPREAGQRDHIFAAVANQPRYDIYRETVHQITTAMLQQRPPAGTMSEAQVTDAIMTYLSDVAMILATNDQRNQILTNPGRTAQCFNLERQAWLTYLGGLGGGADNAALARLTPPPKTSGDVLLEAGGLMTSFFVSVFTNSTSTNKTVQANGAQTTTIQNEVLNDYGLVLQPKGGGIAAPSLFEALNDLGLGPNSKSDALNNLTAACNKHPPNPNEYNLLNPTRQRLTTGTIHEAVNLDTLNAVAWALGAKIRVIQPNGNILFQGYGTGTVKTVLQVDKPAPHYRFAT